MSLKLKFVLAYTSEQVTPDPKGEFVKMLLALLFVSIEFKNIKRKREKDFMCS